MKDVKTKPQMVKPKVLEKAAVAPREAREMLKQQYQEQQARRTSPDGPPSPANYATDKLEGTAQAGAVYTLAAGRRMVKSKIEQRRQKQRAAAQAPGQGPDQQQPDSQNQPPNPPKTAPQAADHNGQAAPASPHNPAQAGNVQAGKAQTGGSAPARSTTATPQQQQQARRYYVRRKAEHKAVVSQERQANAARTGEQLNREGITRRTVKVKQGQQKSTAKAKPARRTNILKTPAAASGRKQALNPGQAAAKKQAAKARRKLQQQTAQQTAKAGKKAAQKSARLVIRAGRAAARLAAAAAKAIAAAGGGVVVVALLAIAAVAALVASPFGVLFANQETAPGAVPLPVAVAQINAEFADYLDSLQAGYDTIELHGDSADWLEVIAVFAAKTAGREDGAALDVVTIDQQRIDLLREVFWDMNDLRTEEETIDHPATEDEDAWTETILHIYLSHSSAQEQATAYHFTKRQTEAMTELLTELRPQLVALAGSLVISEADLREILAALPEDVSPERRQAVEAALSLVGKVNYFWGGKSAALGWDERWGTPMKVSAAGSPSSGTVRPFGLDCSGFVTWIFVNIYGADGTNKIGHGCTAQWNNCTPIQWSQAQPGDLVFYPDNEHCGIVVGRDEDGNLLICHCASGANNVVITGTSGFTKIGRPDCFST